MLTDMMQILHENLYEISPPPQYCVELGKRKLQRNGLLLASKKLKLLNSITKNVLRHISYILQVENVVL